MPAIVHPMTPDERNAALYPQAIHHDPALLAWFTEGVMVNVEIRPLTRYERAVLWLRRVTAWRRR